MKKNNLMSGALVLSIGGVLAKVFSAIYRIALTRVLGGVGIGIYQLIQMKKICKTKSIKELETFLNSILSIDVKLKMFNTDPNCVRLFIAKGSC